MLMSRGVGSGQPVVRQVWDLDSDGQRQLSQRRRAAAEQVYLVRWAFTFEVIIRPDVDPLEAPNNMNIICGERAGSDPRSWQFRITNAGQLHFIRLPSNGAIDNCSADCHPPARMPRSRASGITWP